MAKRRFRVELLATLDGLNFGTKERKKKGTVVVLLWCNDINEAKDAANKIAEALSFSTYVGAIVYQTTSVKLHRKSAAAI